MLFRRRALIVLGLALSFVGMAAPAAHATDYTYRYTGTWNIRNHTGSSTWVPSKVDFNSGWDSNANRAWMVFGFVWDNPKQKMEVGQGITIEINAKVDCDWARAAYTTFYANANGNHTVESGREGYDSTGFQTNIPATSGALPYEDTIVFEPCDSIHKSGTGRGNFGVGVLNAQNLVPGTHYWIKVAMDNANNLPYRGYDSEVELRVKAGVVYDSDTFFTNQDDADCNFDGVEINLKPYFNQDWNDATDLGGFLRQEAGFCSFVDWEQQIDTGTIFTGQNYYPGWSLNKVSNFSMEEGTNVPSSYNFWGIGYATRYCVPPDNPYPAFEGSCFLEYNNAANGSVSISIYQPQSVPTPIGYQPTAEAAVRCRQGSSCPIVLAVWGRGIATDESVNTSYSVPNDDHWYICRMDSNHGPNGTGIGSFVGSHSSLSWELYNTSMSGQNVDVDWAYLGGRTNWKDADTGFSVPGVPGTHYFGVGHAEKGEVCTRK